MISRIRINKSEGGFSSIERTHKRLPAAALLKVADARASLTALASSERERERLGGAIAVDLGAACISRRLVL